MEVKILTPPEWESWKHFRLQALHNSPDAFLSTYQEEVIKSDDAFQRDLQDNTVFVSMDGNTIVSSAGFYQLSPEKVSHRGVLWGMYTSPLHRRKGCAGACIDAVIDYARSRVLQVHLSCVTTNTGALALYEIYGFEIYGTEPRALKINNNFVDEYLMCLQLK